MKKYEEPECEVILLTGEVISTSGDDVYPTGDPWEK